MARTIESFAKDISEKYIEVPYTTEFGIMFLPVESLYAEVLRHPGVFETLQRKYHITITGPTTMSALLNSLQMGFRTLAVTKQSSEVWRILEAVKTEFGKFSEQLEKVDDRLGKAKNELEKLRSTRTNVMARKLREVGTLDSGTLTSSTSRPLVRLPLPKVPKPLRLSSPVRGDSGFRDQSEKADQAGRAMPSKSHRAAFSHGLPSRASGPMAETQSGAQ